MTMYCFSNAIMSWVSLFLTEQKLPEAQAEFQHNHTKKTRILLTAHYGLGVIYETQGDLIRARA